MILQLRARRLANGQPKNKRIQRQLTFVAALRLYPGGFSQGRALSISMSRYTHVDRLPTPFRFIAVSLIETEKYI